MKKSKLLGLGCLLFFLAGPLWADGRLEFSLHYSGWSLNVARGLVENMVSDVLESDLKDRFLAQIQSDYPGLVENGYNQKITYDAPGHNFGFELRFYPGGRQGAFSLGLGIEKSSMKVSFSEVKAELDLIDRSLDQVANFQALAQARFIIKPLSFHLNLRWELWPARVISPFITLGAGLSTGRSFLDASYEYSYSGTLTLPDNSTREYTQSANKTLGDIKDERLAAGRSFSLNFLPLVQMDIGFRARISRALSFCLEAGFFDGFILRGGLAIRT